MDTSSILLYSTSSAAQVWATLVVFQVLLVRDQKAAIDKETDELWNQARYWWTSLIQNLRDKNLPALGAKLSETGLDERTVDRAETDRECFKRVMREAWKRKLIEKQRIPTTTRDRLRSLSPEAFQSTLDPIAERLAELEGIEPDPRKAFAAGMAAIALNIGMLLTLKFLGGYFSEVQGIWGVAVVNVVMATIFIKQVWGSLRR